MAIRIILTPQACGQPFMLSDQWHLWLQYSYYVSPSEDGDLTDCLPWKFWPDPPTSGGSTDDGAGGSTLVRWLPGQEDNRLQQQVAKIVTAPGREGAEAFESAWASLASEAPSSRVINRGRQENSDRPVDLIVQSIATWPAQVAARLRGTHYVRAVVRSVERVADKYVCEVEPAEHLPASLDRGSTRAVSATTTQGACVERVYDSGQIAIRTRRRSWSFEIPEPLQAWTAQPRFEPLPPDPETYCRNVDDFDVFREHCARRWPPIALQEDAAGARVIEERDESLRQAALSLYCVAAVVRGLAELGTDAPSSGASDPQVGWHGLSALLRLAEPDWARLAALLQRDLPLVSSALETTRMNSAVSRAPSSAVASDKDKDRERVKSLLQQHARALQTMASWTALENPAMLNIVMGAAALAGDEPREANDVLDLHAKYEWNSYVKYVHWECSPKP